MFLIPIEVRVVIASAMTWPHEARQALKIDQEIFLRMVLLMVTILWPLMLILRLVAGASFAPALLNILLLTLIIGGLTLVGIFFINWLVFNPAVRGVRRWVVLALYVGLVVSTLLGQVYISSTKNYLLQQSNAPVLLAALIVSRMIGTGLAIYVYFYLLQRKQAAAAQARVLALEQMGREAEIERLRAQINPHFLFNTLTSVAGTTTEPKVEQMILKLADVLRYNLAHMEGPAPFHEELKAMENYLHIEQVRFGSNLVIDWDVAPAARTAWVPQPLLLPLLENAIKYGFETATGPLKIKIKATVCGDELRAMVENTGRWIEPLAPAPRGTQIGLTNLKRRLALYYQGRATFQQESLPEAVRITLTLPLDAAR